MTPMNVIRAVAAFDLIATLPLALPGVQDGYCALLFSGFGLLDAPAGLLPLPMSAALFCNLAGILAVLWNGARCLRPEADWLVRLDVRGRVAVATLLGYYLTRLGAPPALWVFVVTELGGALLEGLALRREAR